VEDQQENLEHPITYGTFLRNRRAMVAAISTSFAMLLLLFYEPLLADRLKEQPFDLSGDKAVYIGGVFALGAFFYGFSSPFVGFLAKMIPRRYVT